MKRVLLWGLLLASLQIQAQVDTVKIGIHGLTCSSCSRAVEEKLYTVNFVQAVFMNLNKNEALVLVDFSKPTDWEGLSNAIYDAGFSVGYLYVPSCLRLPRTDCEETYRYVGPANMLPDKDYYRLAGEKYMDAKQYRIWKRSMKGMTFVAPSQTIYYYY